MSVSNNNPPLHAHHRVNCTLSLITLYSLISNLGLFLTFVLLLSSNSQFIAFNEFSSTGKFPAIYFFIVLILAVFYFALFILSILAIWSTIDILNKWGPQVMLILYLFFFGLLVMSFVQISAGVLSLAYMKTMPGPLREYMADNLRSNYTGGFGVGYLERQYDKSVDWVQINYQCCGVISYEDYRNGFYYNSFNKYTIVNIVPSSCCMYRDPNQPSKCQMKSINIYRKGCYEILMWWMEVFGTLIGLVNILFGFVNLIAGFACLNIVNQIRTYKKKLEEKNAKLRSNSSSRIRYDGRASSSNNYLRQFSALNESMVSASENNTTHDSVSYIETKN